MFRSLIAITVGVTALCFARVPQEPGKAGSDPFGSATEQSEEKSGEAGPFDPSVSVESDGENPFEEAASFGPGQSESTSASSDPFKEEKTTTAEGNFDPSANESPSDSAAHAARRLKRLEKEFKDRETQVDEYATSMRQKYQGKPCPIAVRSKLSKMIEAALVARERLQRQRIHAARLRLDAAESRLSKALMRSSFVVKQRIEQLLREQPDRPAMAKKKTQLSQSSSTSEGANQYTIPPGMRVVTVGIDIPTSHSGMLSPGMRTDVMLTYSVRTDEGSDQRTRTVLQFIEIFAVDRPVDEGNIRNVSVLVTPRQAHILLLARKRGSIYLALRSSEAEDETPMITISESELNELGVVAKEGAAERQENMPRDRYATINDAVKNAANELKAMEAQYEAFVSDREDFKSLEDREETLTQRSKTLASKVTTLEVERVETLGAITAIQSSKSQVAKLKAAESPDEKVETAVKRLDAVVRTVMKGRTTVRQTAESAIDLLNAEKSILETRLEALQKMQDETQTVLGQLRAKFTTKAIASVREQKLKSEVERLRQTYSELVQQLKDVGPQPRR